MKTRVVIRECGNWDRATGYIDGYVLGETGMLLAVVVIDDPAQIIRYSVDKLIPIGLIKK